MGNLRDKYTNEEWESLGEAIRQSKKKKPSTRTELKSAAEELIKTRGNKDTLFNPVTEKWDKGGLSDLIVEFYINKII